MILASDWIAFHADRTPEKVAIIDQMTGRNFTYGEFNDRAARLAAYLRSAWAVQAGDRLAILAKNSSEYFEFQFACIKLGTLMLPLNWRLAVPELLFILNDSGAKGIVYDTEFEDRIPALVEGSSAKGRLRIDTHLGGSDDAPIFEQAINSTSERVIMDPQTTHDTPMTIMYTAGTTGTPKGVLITHGMTFWNATNISIPSGLNCNSVFYAVLPTFHTGGLNLYANPTFHLGGTSIIARQFEPELTLRTLTDPQLGVTHFFGVPANYLFLSQHPDFDRSDLSHIQSWGCGGAPMPVAVLQRYAERGIVIQTGFGMTETSPTVFLSDKRRALEKPLSVGKPLLHTRVRVVDDQFHDVAVGEIGEVCIGGPNITPGYWNRPDANRDSFTVDEFGNRWLHSGDAGTVDDEGCIYVVDRYKDMYISGGENVYPAEVEQVLFQMPQVADVAVIGVPDERWGESGLAVVVLHSDQTLTVEQVQQFCKDKLAKFKTPKQVAFIEVLPRNAAGKVLKRDLRQLFIKEH
ncbi:MAG: long-chain fatty acid--CoA ligase [Anaerolineae bacterium]|nr:long-chain fatty acid--CoA ligase [Anaerolineae bacterium]